MFSSDYFQARSNFRAEAERLGAPLNAVPLADRGPRGQELFIDITYLGATRPRVLLLLTAGIHGIEAPAGCTLLQLWLAEFAHTLPTEAAALLVPVLNPWGYAHKRRANEHNVDLNRNGLDRFPGPDNPDYARIDAWLNPDLPADAGEKFWPGALWHMGRLGARSLRQAIAAGQYTHPRGLFYGGNRREASLEIFARLLSDPNFAAVEQVLHVDIHTGLGRRGDYALLLATRESTPDFASFVRHFGKAHVHSNAPGAYTHYAAQGTIGAVTERAFPTAQVRTCTLEFGTYPALHVLRALRTENRLHHFGCRDSSRAKELRAAFRETFCPDDTAWQNTILSHGRTLFRQLPKVLTTDNLWKS